MMNDVEGLVPDDFPDGFPGDEVPDADAQEQRRLVDPDDEAGLDTDYLSTGAADRDANDADVLEQALIVPTDDWDEIG